MIKQNHFDVDQSGSVEDFLFFVLFFVEKSGEMTQRNAENKLIDVAICYFRCTITNLLYLLLPQATQANHTHERTRLRINTICCN